MSIAGTMSVLGEIGQERIRQVEHHGKDPDTDDSHDLAAWAWYLGERVHHLACPFPDAVLDPRRQLVEIAAIAVAAIESWDRTRTPAARAMTEAELAAAAREFDEQHEIRPPGPIGGWDLQDHTVKHEGGQWVLYHPRADEGCPIDVNDTWWIQERGAACRHLDQGQTYKLEGIRDGHPVITR